MSDVATLLADAESKMNKAVEVAKDDFGAIRTGRAHPAMFNKIMVDYYGLYESRRNHLSRLLQPCSSLSLHL